MGIGLTVRCDILAVGLMMRCDIPVVGLTVRHTSPLRGTPLQEGMARQRSVDNQSDAAAHPLFL
ncbi:MAG: hypothetical protein II661_01310 [Bacteroidales bacterium]|nr:hypothetical protein [Bacteroidales bacterium]